MRVTSGDNLIEGLVNIISNITLGENGYVTVFTSDSTIVTGQNPKDTLNKKITDDDHSNLDPLVKRSMDGQTGVMEISLNGEDSLIFYSKAEEMD